MDAAGEVGDQRIVNVVLEEPRRIRLSPQLEHERKAALFDLIQGNRFALKSDVPGPYVLHMSILGESLACQVRDEAGHWLSEFLLPLGELRRIIKDYFLVCDSYFQAIRSQALSRIEAIDMGRRGLHNEGADLLRERLRDHVEVDHDTARRLFTLLVVLHIRA